MERRFALSAVTAASVAFIAAGCGSEEIKPDEQAMQQEQPQAQAQAQAPAPQPMAPAPDAASAQPRKPVESVELGRISKAPSNSEIKTRSRIPTVKSTRTVADINRMTATHF